MSHSISEVFEAVAAVVPDRECVVFRERRRTYAQIRDRARELASVLIDSGLAVKRERQALQPWESGQAHVGLLMFNGTEYLESSLGCYMARAVPFNINYRYVEHEILYLLNDAGADALVYQATFAPVVERVLPQLAKPVRLLLQVADGSDNGLLSGAVDYESALSSGSAACVSATDGDDLYMLYTGGTTGMPKGTLWRQGDLYDAVFAAMARRLRVDLTSIEEIQAGVQSSTPEVTMSVAPFMHGAAHWRALGAILAGGTVVLPSEVTKLDVHDVWQTVERESVAVMLVVGDAFLRPLCEALEASDYSAPSLRWIVTGGAAASPAIKDRLLARLPRTRIVDGGGASETGPQMLNVSAAGSPATSGIFEPQPNACVVSSDKSVILTPGHAGDGWLAQSGPIPLGYLNDQAKTEATFPIIAGMRMAVPGDRARVRGDGLIELLGRESMTINSGGEKIFAEEVEEALKRCSGVRDVLVVGRPSDQWGQEVVAIVDLVDGNITDDEIIASTREHLARYKRPKEIVRVEQVQRSPSGKGNYAWARDIALMAQTNAPVICSPSVRPGL